MTLTRRCHHSKALSRQQSYGHAAYASACAGHKNVAIGWFGAVVDQCIHAQSSGITGGANTHGFAS